MPLRARVRCRCWEEGRTAPPPVPREAIQFDDQGMLQVDPELPVNDRLLLALLDWREGGCEHRDMAIRDESVAPWIRYHFFYQAVAQLGWDEFPSLEQALPRTKKNQVPPEVAALTLDELEAFRAAVERGMEAACLVVEETEAVILQVPSERKARALAGASTGIDLVLTRDGAVLERAKDKTPLFRSRAFRQHVRFSHGDEQVEGADLVDEQTGEVFDSPVVFGLDGMHRAGRRQVDAFAGRLSVRLRPLSAADFADVLDPFTRALEGAVEVGHNLVWDP